MSLSSAFGETAVNNNKLITYLYGECAGVVIITASPDAVSFCAHHFGFDRSTGLSETEQCLTRNCPRLKVVRTTARI